VGETKAGSVEMESMKKRLLPVTVQDSVASVGQVSSESVGRRTSVPSESQSEDGDSTGGCCGVAAGFAAASAEADSGRDDRSLEIGG